MTTKKSENEWNGFGWILTIFLFVGLVVTQCHDWTQETNQSEEINRLLSVNEALERDVSRLENEVASKLSWDDSQFKGMLQFLQRQVEALDEKVPAPKGKKKSDRIPSAYSLPPYRSECW